MSARLLDGQFHAANILAAIRADAARFELPPHLAIVQVGDDPASTAYVERKVRLGSDAGLTVDAVRADTVDEARAALTFLAEDDSVHGLMLQLPAPDADALIACIPPEKDVDGLREDSPYAPATVQAIEELLDLEDIQLRGTTVAIVGAAGAVGSRLAKRWALRECTLLLADKDVVDLAAITLQADLIVSATGLPGLITPEHVRPGAVVVDVGFTRDGQSVRGDVDPRVAAVASAMSPVPGGVGPLTVVCLLRNTVRAAQAAARAA